MQVGHIPRGVAERLAMLMDERLVTVEGRMVSQNLDGARHYKLGMDMSIYARPSLRHVLEPELAWATPGHRGFDAMREQVASHRGGASGVSGTGNSGSALPKAIDPEMQKLLDGLTKISEDDKHADGVMVSRWPLLSMS